MHFNFFLPHSLFLSPSPAHWNHYPTMPLPSSFCMWPTKFKWEHGELTNSHTAESKVLSLPRQPLTVNGPSGNGGCLVRPLPPRMKCPWVQSCAEKPLPCVCGCWGPAVSRCLFYSTAPHPLAPTMLFSQDKNFFKIVIQRSDLLCINLIWVS